MLVLVGACSGGSDPTPEDVDAPPTSTCDPATVLPSNYRPIATVSAGAVTVTTASGVTSGTIDATAGGLAGSPDNPYIYVDLAAGTKVALDDLAARTSTAWDVALKRSSLRVNGGDSGTGGRKLAVVQANDLASVTAPSTGYTEDDFTDADCMLVGLPGGEPASAFGEWYDYDPVMHTVTPKAEVYVIERPGGTRTALRLVTYYGDATNPMRGAYYQVEWKQLAP
ncbi:MAG: HmuY family protein [Deltaproteobacteria bacterium]|nr:HmuY family protein [Deltaproteobacteria bacterium]